MDFNEIELHQRLNIKRKHENGVWGFLEAVRKALKSNAFKTEGQVYIKYGKNMDFRPFFYRGNIYTEFLRISYLPSCKSIGVSIRSK